MTESYDAIIIGGGPAGAIAALLLARSGTKVCVLEKSRHPRFHIGESILPRNMPLIQELGLEPALRRLPHLPKYGAEFGFGNDPRTMCFGFSDGLLPGSPTFNIERGLFDKMLLDSARDAGADVFEDTAVDQIQRLADDAVAITANGRKLSARILLDCSGQSAVVGRHLNTRRGFDDPDLRKVAYFEHFENVHRLAGPAAGHPAIIMCTEGWFWLIGLNALKTSVGFVTYPGFVKGIHVSPDRLLQWAIARCPVVRERMQLATGPQTNQVLSDFSYTCRPYAGPGYMLVGDAGCFLDPIFSTGVTLAMLGAQQAAARAIEILQGRVTPLAARRSYCRFVEGSTAIFWRLIRNYYRHSFRELFMNGRGPLQVHRAVISILAGQVFPRPAWALRWRLHLFELCVRLQAVIRLVPRRKPCSLLHEEPQSVPSQLAEVQ